MAILGMWMWPASVRVHGAEKVTAYCARAHVTDIYFLTKGLAGTTAHRGEIAPAMCERDLLRELLDAAHGKGIRVHAWFTSASDENYKKQHPESGRQHFVRGADQGLISLTDAAYLAYMERIVREVCGKYDIDGLHLDYIRYNHMLYGWSQADAARYVAAGADEAHLRSLIERTFYHDPKEETCIFDAFRAGDESARAFAHVRRKDVAHFAKTLTQAARSVKKNLILSAALMPEGAYDDIAFAELHYGQNYDDAAKLYDYALPMAYSKAYGKDAAWVKAVAEGTMKRGMKTVVGVHAYEGGTGLTLRDDMAVLDGTPVDGICLFREGATALAFAGEKTLCVYNALEETVTRVMADGHETEITIAPGEEKTMAVAQRPAAVRAFAGEKEISIFVTGE